MIQVAFTDFVFENQEEIALGGCQFSIHGPLRTEDEIVAAALGADVLCMRDQFGKVTSQVFDRLPDLKLIVTRSVGYDHIDLEEAHRRGIAVCNVPDYGAYMIAEHAFGLLLAVARNIVTGDQRYRQEHLFSDHNLQGVELYGKRLGIIGTGRIGVHAIRIGSGFGMRISAHDMVENPDVLEKFDFDYLPLEQLLAESDILSLHVTLNDSTHHLINAQRLAQIKPGAILINTSRGAIVDTQALIDSLRSGHLAGAGLDVLEDERDRYYDFSGLNVVVTPHLGWYTDGAIDRILKFSLKNIAAFLEGEPINRVV
jgi:D-lactate dehydrogenase